MRHGVSLIHLSDIKIKKDRKMYLWETNDLANDLRNNNVTEKEKLKYMLFWVISTIIVSDPVLYIGYEYVFNDSILSIAMLIISAAGTIYCYKINKNGDNNDFICRYVCLSIPVAIRALTILLVIVIIAIAIDLSFNINVLGSDEEVVTTSIAEIIFLSAFMLFIYYYLGKFIKIASTESA